MCICLYVYDYDYVCVCLCICYTYMGHTYLYIYDRSPNLYITATQPQGDVRDSLRPPPPQQPGGCYSKSRQEMRSSWRKSHVHQQKCGLHVDFNEKHWRIS